MQALMLAAGMGRRLGKYTEAMTKCMISVGGRTLLERTVDALKNAGVHKFVMVVGWEADKLVNFMLGIQFNDFVRDGSDYPVVNDLLMVADYLISDYSSIIMDYCILGRPIVCFGYDFEEYNKARGGFYFDLDKEIPSGICHTEDEVLSYILNADYDLESQKARAFRDRHIEVGGHATEICTEKLLK